MKLQAASELYLGGTMIWLIDKDGTDNASSNDLSGIRTANGISQSDTAMLRGWQTTARTAATIQNSCYCLSVEMNVPLVLLPRLTLRGRC